MVHLKLGPFNKIKQLFCIGDLDSAVLQQYKLQYLKRVEILLFLLWVRHYPQQGSRSDECDFSFSEAVQ